MKTKNKKKKSDESDQCPTRKINGKRINVPGKIKMDGTLNLSGFTSANLITESVNRMDTVTNETVWN